MKEYREHYVNKNNILDKINKDGVAVIKDVLNQED